jgi:sirohydrochlorin ferrochelatase
MPTEPAAPVEQEGILIMRALLIVAHGSRRAASNDEVRALCASVAARDEGVYQQVTCAFLELAEPSIPEGVAALIEAGARDITVVPYFLSAGRHVAEDIPAEVAKVTVPDGVTVRIAPYLGRSESMADLLLEQGALPSDPVDAAE